MEFRIIDVSPQDYLYVEKISARDPNALSRALGEGLAAVFGFAADAGLTAQTPPMTVYYDFNALEMKFRAALGISGQDAASDAVRTAAGVQLGQLPGGRVLAFRHTGPFADLGSSYDTAMTWMQEQGLAMALPAWEVYLDDPDTVAPAALRTDIFIALK